MKIYHMPLSRSTRVIWAAEELGVPYELVVKQRIELKKPDYLAINPLGNAPAIQDGEVTMTESSAIVQYLIDRHDADDRLAPDRTSQDRAAYLQWLHFGEATLMAPISAFILATGRFSGKPADEPAMAAAKKRLQAPLALADEALSRHSHIAGDRLSGADITLYWNLMIGLRLQAIDPEQAKNIAAYAQRLEHLPGLRKAMEVPAGFVNQPPGSV